MTCPTCGNTVHPRNSYAARRQKFCSERCRKAQYSRPCADCGKPLHGASGRGPNAPTRCLPCTNAHNAKFGREGHIAAIQRFAERYGKPPSATDFQPALARRIGHPEKADRFYADGDYPTTTAVLQMFGSWNAAIEAAGFEPVPVGSRRVA